MEVLDLFYYLSEEARDTELLINLPITIIQGYRFPTLSLLTTKKNKLITTPIDPESVTRILGKLETVVKYATTTKILSIEQTQVYIPVLLQNHKNIFIQEYIHRKSVQKNLAITWNHPNRISSILKEKSSHTERNYPIPLFSSHSDIVYTVNILKIVIERKHPFSLVHIIEVAFVLAPSNVWNLCCIKDYKTHKPATVVQPTKVSFPLHTTRVSPGLSSFNTSLMLKSSSPRKTTSPGSRKAIKLVAEQSGDTLEELNRLVTIMKTQVYIKTVLRNSFLKEALTFALVKRFPTRPMSKKNSLVRNVILNHSPKKYKSQKSKLKETVLSYQKRRLKAKQSANN